jgi:hypothetical protein
MSDDKSIERLKSPNPHRTKVRRIAECLDVIDDARLRHGWRWEDIRESLLAEGLEIPKSAMASTVRSARKQIESGKIRIDQRTTPLIKNPIQNRPTPSAPPPSAGQKEYRGLETF